MTNLNISPLFLLVSIVLLLIFFGISIHSSINYGKKHKSILKWILKICLSWIITYWIFYVLWLGYFYGTWYNARWIRYNSSSSIYYYGVFIWCFIFLYGTLSYHKKMINTWLILWGYIWFIIPWSIILSWGINDSYKLILWSVVILLVVLATLDNEPSQEKIKKW